MDDGPLAPVVGLFRAVGGFFKGNMKWPTINYIIVHYLIMIGLTLTGSIILSHKGLEYINAILFAAGSATQSGLNPVDINSLSLYQQVTLMLIACVANPIFINTSVVFVRLHWFRKRFKHVVEKDNEAKRTKQKTITRTKSQMRDSVDLERGPAPRILGKQIRVLHHTTRPNGMSGSTANRPIGQNEHEEKMRIDALLQSASPSPEGSNNDGHQSERTSTNDDQSEEENGNGNLGQDEPDSHHLGLHPKLNREITFADEVADSGAGQIHNAPTQPNVSKHIEFLQRQQQNAKKEGGTLRIPGPKDFDKGEGPVELADSDDDGLHRLQTRNTLGAVNTADSENERRRRRASDDRTSSEIHPFEHPRQAITFNEPDHPGHREARSEEPSPTEMSTIGRIRSRLGRGRPNSQKSQFPSKASFSKTWSNLTSNSKSGDPMPYLSWQATTGRNSQFTGLNEQQREELGGIEYRALKTLLKILIGYYVGFHTLGMMVFTPWILHAPHAVGWKNIVIADGVNPAWWGIFTPASMFNDLGFTLTPDSMVSFQTSVLVMMLGSFLIIIGNTGFPCMLRFTIWVVSKFVPYGGRTWEELRFLLDHPRRCFTLLFPSRATWWLFWILVLLNGTDLLFFCVLDLYNTEVTHLPVGYRVLDGLFQAASTRTAGFACVNIANLHPAVQVSYLIMMYISVFPIAISVRRTNVYEEKSLGIWGGEETGDESNDKSFVGQHLRRQLSFDLWYVFLGWFIICIVEGNQLAKTDDYAFTMFSVLFEIVSAYGTVGLSLGFPNTNTSFVAQFHVVSKLVIIAMMIRGRHRGLPYALDRAILLPSENLQKKDEEVHFQRRSSTVTVGNEGQLPLPHNLRRQSTWEDCDLDEYGLPRQHVGAATTGMGGANPDMSRLSRRRPSAFSTASDEQRRPHHRRTRSFSHLTSFVASGLSAGPTMPREHD